MGADFCLPARALAVGIEEHIRRDGLSPVKAAVFRDRGGHAPGEECPQDSPERDPEDCLIFEEGDHCAGWYNGKPCCYCKERKK